MGRTQDISEQGAEMNISIQEGASGRKLEKLRDHGFHNVYF
jgi:hypothetical protein